MKCGGVFLVILLCIETIHSKDLDICLAPKPCSCVEDNVLPDRGYVIVNCRNKKITNDQLKRMKFPNTKNYIILDLNENELTHFPVEINFKKSQFHTLQLKHNKISYIGHSPTLVKSKVTYINLGSNKINGTLRLSNLTGFVNVQNLDLSFNKLSNIEAGAFSKMLELRSLNLRDNRLSTISANTFTNNRRLIYLYFKFNPIVCDCNMYIFKTAIRATIDDCNWRGNAICEKCTGYFFRYYKRIYKYNICPMNSECYTEVGELFNFEKNTKRLDLQNKSFTCKCKYGYEGKYCKSSENTARAHFCFPNFCKNNGTCKAVNNLNRNLNYLHSYECSCVLGYSGKNCEIKDPCLLPNNTCHHKGICHRINGINFECYCEYPWVGEKCEELHVCQRDNPCQNNATCKHLSNYANSSNEYECDCKARFVGRNCQQINTCLTNNPCHPNGTESCKMVPGNHSYEVDCICKAGYNGSTCTELTMLHLHEKNLMNGFRENWQDKDGRTHARTDEDNSIEDGNERRKGDKRIITLDGKKNPNLQIILGISISITAIVILAALFYWFHKKNQGVENNHLLQEMEKGNSVFVLYLHGCEIYHKFLRNFTLILHSHGAKVHIALSEQTKIDAEGGIKLFTERHMLNSDYTLVMLSETNQIPHLHMDYEYGMHLMRNQINNQDDCTKYVPIYLDGKRNEQLMPPFLAGCRNYSLPTDFEDLLLMFIDEVELTRVDRIRISNMEKLSQEMASNHHNRCIRTYCGRGRIEPSVSKLSSSMMSLSTVKDDFHDRRRLPSITESVDGEMRHIDNFIQSLPNYQTLNSRSRSMPEFKKPMEKQHMV